MGAGVVSLGVSRQAIHGANDDKRSEQAGGENSKAFHFKVSNL